MRVIAATHQNLETRVKDGLFREDLFHRLNVIRVRLPSLRERREDIAAMASAFLGRFATRYQRDGLSFSPSALRTLEQYGWPGNVRELSHVIERAVLMGRRGQIDQFDFSLQTLAAASTSADVALPANMTLEQAEQAMVRNALDQCGGNIQRAADVLGLSRAALYRRLEKFGIQG